MINFVRMTVLKDFVEDNIIDYNNNHKDFTAKKLKAEYERQKQGGAKVPDSEIEFTDSEIGVYLTEKLRIMLSDTAGKDELDKKLNALKGCEQDIESGLQRIANTNIFAVKDLREYYKSLIMKRIQTTYKENTDYLKKIVEIISGSNKDAKETDENIKAQNKYIKKDLECSVDKALYLALANGFTNKRLNINTGTKMANEGDSAQFLFLARAVLAGYTCSNVDVRSCRYDALIDYYGKLLRVQVKGISGNTIMLKDRDRGGAGVDTKAKRNQGRFISSKENDLYVAVDKQFGICYIIPTTDIDKWVAEGKTSVTGSVLDGYKENWDKISETANRLMNGRDNDEFKDPKGSLHE
jgi:hypothetical protein